MRTADRHLIFIDILSTYSIRTYRKKIFVRFLDIPIQASWSSEQANDTLIYNETKEISF